AVRAGRGGGVAERGADARGDRRIRARTADALLGCGEAQIRPAATRRRAHRRLCRHHGGRGSVGPAGGGGDRRVVVIVALVDAPNVRGSTWPKIASGDSPALV